jgi:hypothetical protein
MRKSLRGPAAIQTAQWTTHRGLSARPMFSVSTTPRAASFASVGHAMKSLPMTLLPVACLALCSCNQYLERKESVTMSAGDAVAANEAAQTIDPWPRHSQDTNIPMDGEKAVFAVRKYRGLRPNGQPGGGAGGASGGAGGGSPAPATF